MKPHPPPHRIRKTIKWGGAVVTVLLVVVWVGSGWWMVRWRCVWEGWLACGRVKMWQDGSSYPLIARIMPVWRGPMWNADLDGLGVPLWIPTLCVFSAAAIAWRLDTVARRREDAHLCPKCNYDRTGLAIGAVCPECGMVPVSTKAASARS